MIYKGWILAKLVAMSGPLAGATLRLGEAEVSVGRDENNLIELIADVIPASRGAVMLSGDGPAEIVSASAWSDLSATSSIALAERRT